MLFGWRCAGKHERQRERNNSNRRGKGRRHPRTRKPTDPNPKRCDFRGGRRFWTSSCRTCCPTNDATPGRTVHHSDRKLDASGLAAVSSRPRKTVRWDLVEIAAGRTEEDNRAFLQAPHGFTIGTLIVYQLGTWVGCPNCFARGAIGSA
jgi:hypothetical protein